MGKVLNSAHAGATVYVFADDHCPPHVHARHRGNGWTARVRFSYVTDQVSVMSVTPLNMPIRPRVITSLLKDVQHSRLTCRRAWWDMQRTTCLANKWAVVRDEQLHVLDRQVQGARQIDLAIYDPEHDCSVISFRDATDFVLQAIKGMEQ